VHQRVARTFRQGGAVIVGDAAHVNSPIGGMGLNSGIHDAVDLSRVVAEGGDLAEWARRRRRVALDEIQRITHENTQRLSEVRTAQADGDHELLAEIAADPVRSREFLLEASMIANARRHTLRP
jgi:3-(3-hydroxy-phenyl)propionate hydroxylase